MACTPAKNFNRVTSSGPRPSHILHQFRNLLIHPKTLMPRSENQTPKIQDKSDIPPKPSLHLR